MSTVRESPADLELDYYRRMVRKPPSKRNRGAHLAWVRIIAKMLAEIEQWAPYFTTAFVAKERSVEAFRPFCEQRFFERAYLEQKPRPLLFLEHFFQNSNCNWLADLGRVELGLSCLLGRVPEKWQDMARTTAKMQTMEGQQFVVVSHDVLETLQALTGFMEMTLSRTGRLLWFLNVDPVYPILEPPESVGLIVFVQKQSDWGLSFIPAGQS